MIERKFVNQKMKEFQIQEYIGGILRGTGYSHTEIQRTPLGEKIIIFTTRPGVVVGKKGENINKLTTVLKKKFKMENPQIEIGEVVNELLDVNYVADRIASTLERFGPQRFKSVGYKMLQNILDAGALGAEIVISGKVPSARAKSWRFKAGYLKKSGDLGENFVNKACSIAKLKSGVIGIRVSIMPPDVILPDKIIIKLPEAKTTEVKTEVKAPEVNEEKKEEKVEEKKEEKPKKKRAPRKKKEEKKEETTEKADGDNKKE